MHIDVPPLEGHRKLIFGFDITRQWLLDYAESLRKYLTDPEEELSDMDKLAYALDSLRMDTGYGNVFLAVAKPNTNAIANETAIPGKNEVWLIKLCTVSTRRSTLRDRPTQSQYEKLCRIVGRPATWWVR
jgi:hypothetical protein